MKYLIFICLLFQTLISAGQVLDTTFNGTGILYPDIDLPDYKQSGFVLSIVEQPDGKLLILTRLNHLWRVNADGTPDFSFGGGSGYIEPMIGTMNTNFSENIINMRLLPDGSILIVSNNVQSFNFRKLDSNGNPDNTFGTNGFKSTVLVYSNLNGFTPTIQPKFTPDDKVLFTTTAFANGASVENENYTFFTVIAKFTLSGDPDTSFSDDGYFFINRSALDMALEGNKIYYCGGTNIYGPGPILMRIDYNTGLPDNSFGVNGSISPGVASSFRPQKLIPFPDGSLWFLINYVAVPYTNPVPALQRLDTNQQIDTSFGTNGVKLLDVNFEHYLRLPDNKILLAGKTAAPGYEICGVERFNPDGTVDTNNGLPAFFSSALGAIGASPATCITLGNDGKYLVGGGYRYFPVPSGTPYAPVVWRLVPSVPLGVPSFKEGLFYISRNPVKEQIELNYPDTETLEKIVLVDGAGRFVKEFQANLNNGSNDKIQLQLPSGLSDGLYFLNVSTKSNSQISIKVLKESGN